MYMEPSLQHRREYCEQVNWNKIFCTGQQNEIEYQNLKKIISKDTLEIENRNSTKSENILRSFILSWK